MDELGYLGGITRRGLANLPVEESLCVCVCVSGGGRKRRRLRFLLEDLRLAESHYITIAMVREEIEKRRKTQKPSFLLKVPFTRRLACRSLQRLIFQDFPIDKVSDDTRVAVSLNCTLGQLAKNSPILTIRGRRVYPCHCETLQKTGVHQNFFRNGHLATNDVQAVLRFMNVDVTELAWKEIQVIWFQGSKFRSAINIEESTKLFSEAISGFAKDVLESRPISETEQYREKLRLWSHECALRYQKACNDQRNYIVTEKTLQIIADLKQHFVITSVDKNSQSLSILCMAEYMKRLEDHMKSSTYETVQTPIVDILQQHKKVCRSFGCTYVQALPYIYIIPKLHKEPSRPFDRFIAGYSHLNNISGIKQNGKPSSSLAKLSAKVSDFFNGIIDILLLQDQRSIRKGKPKSFWIIRDIGEAYHVLNKVASLHTNDFSTMYTNFPHDALIHAVRSQVTKACKFMAQAFFKVDENRFNEVIMEKETSSRRCKWFLGNPQKINRWGCQECLEAFEYLVRNSYFSNTFGVVLQTIGVAMGAPHSGPAANLGLSYAECTYVDRQLATHGPEYVRRKLKNFMHYTRYIDDMGTEFADIPSTTDYFGMAIVNTGHCPPDPTIDLLSYTFQRVGGALTIHFKNKQKAFPILLVRFPGHFSTITPACRIGCVIGGLVTIYRYIDSPTHFSTAINEFFEVLKARRFTTHVIRAGIIKFLRKNCKKQYVGFLLQHFFIDIISTWPYDQDIPGDRVIHEEYLRHELRLDIPHLRRMQLVQAPVHSAIPATQRPDVSQLQARVLHHHNDAQVVDDLNEAHISTPRPESTEGSTSSSSNASFFTARSD